MQRFLLASARHAVRHRLEKSPLSRRHSHANTHTHARFRARRKWLQRGVCESCLLHWGLVSNTVTWLLEGCSGDQRAQLLHGFSRYLSYNHLYLPNLTERNGKCTPLSYELVNNEQMKLGTRIENCIKMNKLTIWLIITISLMKLRKFAQLKWPYEHLRSNLLPLWSCHMDCTPHKFMRVAASLCSKTLLHTASSLTATK
jgi:hypothetical protein